MQEMTRRLWLVRHGSTVWNQQRRFFGHTDIPLSPEGQLQARWLAGCLADRSLSAIYASDLLRASETAAIIARGHARLLPVQTMAAWRELDFGAWEGLTYDEVRAQFPGQLDFLQNPPAGSPPGGESLVQLEQRIMDGLTSILATNETSSNGDIVIVSHAGPLRMLLHLLLGMPMARQWQFELATGSLSALDLWPTQDQPVPWGTLVLLNMHRSLASLLALHPARTIETTSTHEQTL
jgi:broad specificity phosphatase PhoE